MAGGKGRSTVLNEDNCVPGSRRSATQPEVRGFWEWGSLGKEWGVWEKNKGVWKKNEWVWGGCLFMALGGVLAMSDKRYRLKLKRVAA